MGTSDVNKLGFLFLMLTSVFVFTTEAEYHGQQGNNHIQNDNRFIRSDQLDQLVGNDTGTRKRVMDVRLPRSIKPLHYLIKLIPFINGNFSIHGYVALKFQVLENTNNITMHINGINTHNHTVKVSPVNDPNDVTIPIKRHIYDADRNFYIVLLYNEDLKAGLQYVISLEFTGYLNDNMNGFYRSSYNDGNGNKRWIAATQFQPTDARKAFPCLDEPALKANFTIELGREKSMKALSNMPLNASVPMEGNADWVWDKFESSVPMSTYLVAFVISDFNFTVNRTKEKTYDFKVWARKSAIDQTKYALTIGPPASKFFEDFFQVPYPLPKQDMVALPDFSAGAMENWGLITYRETTMLFDEKISTASNKERVGSVIAHELAHQWFGNLVTPSWWTDLWLNEGFASYMQYLALNAVEPTFQMMEQFIIDDLHTALALDCLESSHPINIEVQHPDQISEIFDKISYSKGASIIRMMHHFLGEDTFKKGLSNYLKGLAYSSAEQNDLWRYLTDQAMADASLPQDLTVKDIMDTWTMQMGFPLITVTKNNDGTAVLAQERFLLLRNENTIDQHDYKWWIPITFVAKSNPDFSVTKPMAWMKQTETTKVINGVPANDWIIFNIQQTGFYRVNYDQENWKAIIGQLIANNTLIHSINRAQIIDDAVTLARSGLLPYQTAMEVFSYLKYEESLVPWEAALNGLQFISNMLAHSGGYGAFKSFILNITVPLYKKIGFADKTTDPHLVQRKRAIILKKVCDLGYDPCIEEAVSLFKKWKKDPENFSVISPNLKYVVYCTAIENGGYEEWKFAWERYLKTDVASEKQILLYALGCTKETWIQSGYLENALTPERGIRKQDVASVISAVANTVHGKILAWEFFKDNYNRIFKMFEGGSFTMNGIVKSVTSKLNTWNHLAELKEFQKEKHDKFGSAERAVQQAVEVVGNNMNWMDDHFRTIIQWLSDNGYSDNPLLGGWPVNLGGCG